jgi:hypothetical protein
MTIVDKLAAANGGRLVLTDAAPHGLVARLEFPPAAAESDQGAASAPDAAGKAQDD